MSKIQKTIGNALEVEHTLSLEVPVGYKRTQVGVIPEDWESSSVRGIASSSRNAIVGGPFGSDLVSKDYVAYGVPVIRGQNMRDRWVSGSFVFVTPIKAKSLEANLAYPGDIIFTQRGTLGQVSLVPDKPFSAYLVSQSQMKLSVDRKVTDPVFLLYFFLSDEQQKIIQSSTIQTGVPHINLGILCEIPVRLPPLAEQYAIAEALSDVDGLLTALETLTAKKRAVKQAAMQQLLTGKTRLPGFRGKWETKRLGDIFTIRVGSSKSQHIANGGRYFIVDMGSVAIDGRLISAKRTDYDGDFLAEGELVMPKDDIGGGKIIGKVAYIDANDLYVLGDHVYALRPMRGYPKFFSYLINHHETNSSLKSKVGGSAQLGLSRKAVEEQEIPVPALKEQIAIAAILSDMDAEIATLERRRDKTHAIKQGMMQQLLTGRVRLVKPDLDSMEG